jgi:hypothetical protein
MSPGLQLGVDQLAINFDFETPAIRRDQRNFSDFGLKLFDQISRQTDGAVGVVSNLAVLDVDFVCHKCLLDLIKDPAGDATGMMSQPHSNGVRPILWFIPFAQITVAAPAQVIQIDHRSFHLAAPWAIQHWRTGGILSSYPLSVPPPQAYRAGWRQLLSISRLLVYDLV